MEEMKKPLLLIIFLLAAAGMKAQDNTSEQVLVFRNTGEVNLFYTDRLQRIEFSRFDADSVEHESIVSQVFCTMDTTMFVPVSQIDSVAFGQRNEEVRKEGVRNMQEEDCQWIIRYEENRIYYKKETPGNILPKKGEKLFYGKEDDLFPTGLIARVDAVTLQHEEYVVSVSDLELSDVFERLFYAGKIGAAPPYSRSGKKISSVFDHSVRGEMEVAAGPMALTGKYEFEATGNVVANPLKGYYYLSLDGTTTIDGHLEAKGGSSFKGEKEMDLAKMPLGVYALVFTPNLSLNSFLEIEAEAAGHIGIKRTLRHHLKYEKHPKKDPVMEIRHRDNEDTNPNDSITAGLTLRGSVYGGVSTTFDFNILKETAGARAKLKIGPRFSGEFGMEVLRAVAGPEYNANSYAKFVLECCTRLGMTGSVYKRSIFTGSGEEHELFNASLDIFKRDIDLFPIFARPTAVNEVAGKNTNHRNETISVSVKTKTELPYKLDLNFEIVDARNEPIDSISAGTLEARKKNVQGVAAIFEDTDLKGNDVKEVSVRPVFYYGTHKVKAMNIGIKSDMQIQPVVYAMCSGATTVLSGYPYSGQATFDGVHYQAGPYIPVPVADTVFVKELPVPSNGNYLTEEQREMLAGTWKGTGKNQKEVIYKFNDDETGTCETDGHTRNFIYAMNSPQSGDILLQWTDDNSTLVMKAVYIGETEMRYSLANDREKYILKRKND